MRFGPRIMSRLDQLAQCSESHERLCRQYLSREHTDANARLSDWMREAGMAVHVDAVGNVVGRYDGEDPDAPALVMGSHQDTVRDAGRYDGAFGILAAIECVAALAERGARLPHALEVYAFGDEEGVRFGTTLIGSSAVAGDFQDAWLERTDEHGTSMSQALTAFGLDPRAVQSAARPRQAIAGFVEVHIEQGPVLENDNLALGVVTAIAGASRYAVRVTGMAGHAGTVPMHMRADALSAAAEMVLAVEHVCTQAGVVGTVGRIETTPGAVNVICGEAIFSLDLRAGDDTARERALAELFDTWRDIAARRNVTVTADKTHESGACQCDAALTAGLAAAARRFQDRVPHMPSGAGHDAMAMASVTPVAMLFVRCKGGISHHPDEHLDMADADVACEALSEFLNSHGQGET